MDTPTLVGGITASPLQGDVMPPATPAAPAGFDIFAAAPANTTVYTVLQPDRVTETPWRITLAGPAHEKTLAHQDKQRRKNLRIAEAQENARVNGKKYKAEEKTPEEERRESALWIISRIVSWEGFAPGGVVTPFSDELGIKIFSDPRFSDYFMQIAEVINEATSFTKGSAGT